LLRELGEQLVHRQLAGGNAVVRAIV
jgi:hypothetical protein